LYFVRNEFELGEADGEFALDEVALGAEPSIGGDFVHVVDDNVVVDIDLVRRTAFMPVLCRRVFLLLRQRGLPPQARCMDLQFICRVRQEPTLFVLEASGRQVRFGDAHT